MPDPIEILKSLTPEQLRSRLADMQAEEAAIRILLRSVVARDRAKLRSDARLPNGREAAHA